MANGLTGNYRNAFATNTQNAFFCYFSQKKEELENKFFKLKFRNVSFLKKINFVKKDNFKAIYYNNKNH